jgi:TRAP-type C4-dicarboxylate transport system permease large subunit
MIFFIVVGASVFNSFLSSAQVPQTMAEFFRASDLNPWLVLTGMLLLYLILGTVMDSLAMIFLTVPVFVPIVMELDFGLTPEEVGIWFGILVLMAAEVGLITPPVGLNLFVINAMSKDVPIGQTYKGILPFVASDIVRIAVLAAFPAISLWLVRLLN